MATWTAELFVSPAGGRPRRQRGPDHGDALAMKSSCPRLADLSLCIVEELLGTLK
jgi:hypothetical protein